MWASTRATKSSASTASAGSSSWPPHMSALGDRADIGFSVQLRYHPQRQRMASAQTVDLFRGEE